MGTHTHTHTYTHTYTHTITHHHTHTHTHTPSHTHTHTITHTHTHTHTHTITHTHAPSHTHTHTYTCTITHPIMFNARQHQHLRSPSQHPWPHGCFFPTSLFWPCGARGWPRAVLRGGEEWAGVWRELCATAALDGYKPLRMETRRIRVRRPTNHVF